MLNCISDTIKRQSHALSFSFHGLIFQFSEFSSSISNEALGRCKQRIELIADTLQLEGFSRIDAFVNVDSGEVSSFYDVIE